MKKTLSALMIMLLLAPAVRAQDMPAPRRMPRIPVSREALTSPHDAAPSSHRIEGGALILDGEKLRIGETDVHLFGIVPPQLDASFGPQARRALDSLTANQNIGCDIRDRDREGRLLAVCRNAAGNDLAWELLKRGLAVTARGALANTEFASPYVAAEQAAENAHIGLWSVTLPAPVPDTVVVMPTPAPVAAAVVETKPELKKDDKQMIAADSQKINAQKQEQILAQARIDDVAWNPPPSVGFFERYQILIACGLMVATTLCILTALWAQKRRDRSDEMKAIAAALRGELMAARSLCIGRAKSIGNDDEDRAVLWPRLRSTLYQAAVARLGVLGADLARHIASIYGQAADYAALYSPSNGSQNAPKKQALENLAKHIDVILPILASIEKTGYLPRKPSVLAVPATVTASPTLSYRETPRQSQKRTSVDMPATISATGLEPAMPQPAKKSISPKTVEEITMPQVSTPPPHVMTNDAPPIKTIPSMSIGHVSNRMWDHVRHLFASGRPVSSTLADASSIDDYSEYETMIEADMAHYQYNETIDSFDINPDKKRG